MPAIFAVTKDCTAEAAIRSSRPLKIVQLAKAALQYLRSLKIVQQRYTIFAVTKNCTAKVYDICGHQRCTAKAEIRYLRPLKIAHLKQLYDICGH